MEELAQLLQEFVAVKDIGHVPPYGIDDVRLEAWIRGYRVGREDALIRVVLLLAMVNDGKSFQEELS